MHVIRWVFFLFVAIGMFFLNQTWAPETATVRAQAGVPLGNRWSLPVQVPGYDVDAEAPYLVADKNHTVHAFNSVVVGKELVIMYSQWTLQNGWSSPVDILLSPLKDLARIKGVFLDSKDMVHVIFFGGDELEASIFYSKAPLAQASRATAWMPVEVIGEHAIIPPNAALTGDGNGNLYAIFSGDRDGIGLYGVSSGDSGFTWSEPELVFLSPDEEHWPNALRLIQDDQGNLHAAWTLVNRAGNGDAIYYARNEPGRRQWSDPFILATRDPGDYEADWPSIVSHEGKLIVVYDDSNPATRWVRVSDDAGITWSDPVLPFNYVGEYRHAAFAVDSENYLHMLLGNRTPQGTHGMWHSVWLGNRWSELEPVISGPRVISGPMSGRFDPNGPQAVISQGNVLLVTWMTDPGAGRNGIWSSYAVLNVPELEAVPLRPDAPPTPTPQPLPTRDPALGSRTAERINVVQQIPETVTRNAGRMQSPLFVLALSILPVVLLILIIYLAFRNRLKHSR